MRKASIRDLHLRTGAIVREASQGRVIVIERRGTPVAELRPIERPSPAKVFRELEPFLAKFPKLKGDSGKFISQSRDRG
jgi:antitoxin (DNA-binding transcriptional repressor) of toxin-antitoxin stability system